jgi:hypothetical protein
MSNPALPPRAVSRRRARRHLTHQARRDNGRCQQGQQGEDHHGHEHTSVPGFGDSCLRGPALGGQRAAPGMPLGGVHRAESRPVAAGDAGSAARVAALAW